MTMPVQTRTRPKGNTPAKGQAAPPTPTRPFRVGVQSHEEINYDNTLTQSAGTQDFPSFELPPQGFLRGVWLIFAGTASTNAATVAYAANQLDAPFNIIDTIELDDTNSKPLIGPFGGYDLYLINKYGGYMYGQDPKKFPGYTADSGAGATITINFLLRIPVELVARDALGALPNKSGTNKFRIKVRLAAITTVFATAPTNAMSCRLRMVPENWWEPDEFDLKGRPLRQSPPASQTTQYWTKGNYSLNSGDQRVQIQQGLGFLIRNIIFINRTTGDLRSSAQDAFFPDPATIQFEANTLFDRPRTLWQHYIWRLWNLSVAVATSDVVAATGGGGRDYCVYPLTFTDDFSLIPGAEVRRGLLATSDGSRLEFRGNQGGSTNFNVLVNYVAPARMDDAAITT
jgi:hypothetical protein